MAPSRVRNGTYCLPGSVSVSTRIAVTTPVCARSIHVVQRRSMCGSNGASSTRAGESCAVTKSYRPARCRLASERWNASYALSTPGAGEGGAGHGRPLQVLADAGDHEAREGDSELRAAAGWRRRDLECVLREEQGEEQPHVRSPRARTTQRNGAAQQRLC